MHHIETLQSMHVLVTRPSASGTKLCSDIEQLGGKTFLFPVIQISAPEDSTSLKQAIKNLQSFDIAIFISPTAVFETSKYIDLSSLSMKIAAIGSSTASALKHLSVDVDIIPKEFNSESLLEHEQLQPDQIKNRRIVIFKGEGGRNLLSKTLSSRGAIVSDANMYSRSIPTGYTPLSSDQIDKTDVVLVTSGEGLKNLLEMAQDKSKLINKKIIVPGKRCSAIAKQLGFTDVETSKNATTPAFIDALINLDNSN